MQKIYLIRHGMPQLPEGKKICLGTTDLPLSPAGRMQAVLLAEQLKTEGIRAVYTSPLCRALETAKYLCRISADPHPEIISDLGEQDMGDWDGLDFDEIRAGWPELYRLRGNAPELAAPGGETLADACGRFSRAMDQILADLSLSSTEAAAVRPAGPVAVVAHASVILAWRKEKGTFVRPEDPWYRPPYGSYFCIGADASSLCAHGDAFSLCAHKCASFLCAHPELTPDLCMKLMRAAGTPENVSEHGRAVASLADSFADRMTARGYEIDRALLHRCALLHDIARLHPRHERTGSAWLEAAGYTEEASVIARHNDLLPEADGSIAVSEASLLYLADKMTKDTSRVTLAERFAASARKCKTPEALEALRRRYHIAAELEKTVLL